MKIMREYNLKGKEIFVGLEDSKKSWKLCVIYNKEVVDRISIPAKYEVLEKYFNYRFPQCKINLIYEAGFKGFWLHDLLQKDGINCVVTPPHLVKEEKANKVKTDKRDALRLARNLFNDDYVKCYVHDREQRGDRQISRTLYQVQKNITRTKNQIRRMLEFHGYDNYKPGYWGDRTYLGLLDDLELPESLQFSLQEYIDLLQLLLKQKQELRGQLKELCKQERYKKSVEIYQSSPGIGWLTAIRLTLELGEMSRFRNRKHLSSYLGLTPSEYSTGETVRKGNITRQGNKFCRKWLVQSAWVAINKDPVLMEKYKSVLGSSGKSQKAIIAVARILACRLRYLQINQENYCVGVVSNG